MSIRMAASLGFLISLGGTLFLARGPAAVAQNQPGIPYRIDFDPAEDVQKFDRDGKLMLKVKFVVSPEKSAYEGTPRKYKVVIIELLDPNDKKGKLVKELDVIPPPADEELSVVLAMDISGSMKEHGRIEQARKAAGVFFNSLPKTADCGLILFNHKIEGSVPPSPDRESLRRRIDSAQPNGGTAYLDATSRAIDMLNNAGNKSKAVVLLTDGVDINSDATLDMVIAKAKKAKVRVYTIGIGEPGRQDRVTSVLVLDKSGSMNLPANNTDKRTKIAALRDAANRFVNSIGSTRRSTILEFSDTAQTPRPFTNDKFALKRLIKTITAQGETALFDAVYTAVATLDADPQAGVGKRAVVAMTDGIDNSSRRRVDEVIGRANEAKIPLFLLGFGREKELDIKTMEEMAQKTRGKFYYAENDQKLLQLFENLSIQLHDDGIDEESLIQLAVTTRGTYSPAKNLSRLDFILQRVTKQIQGIPYYETFPSMRQIRDGLPRYIRIGLKEVEKGTQTVQEGQEVDFSKLKGISKAGSAQVSGLVIAEMTPTVYLAILGVLCGLIALPAMLKRRRTS